MTAPKPPNYSNWTPQRQARSPWGSPPQAPNHPAPPQTPGQGQGPPNLYQPPPAYQPVTPPQPFLPFNAAYESGLRSLTDMTSAAETQYRNQLALIQPNVDFQMARMGTDQGYANESLDTSLVDRGMYDSGTNPYLRTRDIGIPYDRSRQDLALEAERQTAEAYTGLGNTNLGYEQGLAQLYLQLAAQQAQDLPLSLYQGGPAPPANGTTYAGGGLPNQGNNTAAARRMPARSAQNVPPNHHINAAGQIVPNTGSRR